MAGHPTRQVGGDEARLRAVSAWLGERGISPRSTRWLSLVRSGAAQRMAIAARGSLSFPSMPVSPAFSVSHRSSDAMTRGSQPVAPSRISSIQLTLKGVPPPSSSMENTRMFTTLGVPQQSGLIATTSLGTTVSAAPPPSGLIASPSLGNSVSSVSSVPKPDGIVETSLKDEIRLDQQLTTAFQTGLRHSLDDSDHDAMSVLSEK